MQGSPKGKNVLKTSLPNQFFLINLWQGMEALFKVVTEGGPFFRGQTMRAGKSPPGPHPSLERLFFFPAGVHQNQNASRPQKGSQCF